MFKSVKKAFNAAFTLCSRRPRQPRLHETWCTVGFLPFYPPYQSIVWPMVYYGYQYVPSRSVTIWWVPSRFNQGLSRLSRSVKAFHGLDEDGGKFWSTSGQVVPTDKSVTVDKTGWTWRHVRQRGGTGWGNVTGLDCRGCRARFFGCQKFCHGSHGADKEPRPYQNGLDLTILESTY